MKSELSVSEDTLQWIYAAEMEVACEPGNFMFASDFSNTCPHQILEYRAGGTIPWLEAEERSMRISWRRGFASLELAEKWILKNLWLGVRENWCPSSFPLVVCRGDNIMRHK